MSVSRWLVVGGVAAAFLVWCTLVITVYPPPEPIETTVEKTVEDVVEVEKTVDQYVEVDLVRSDEICREQGDKKQKEHQERVREGLESGEITPGKTPSPPERVPHQLQSTDQYGVCHNTPQY